MHFTSKFKRRFCEEVAFSKVLNVKDYFLLGQLLKVIKIKINSALFYLKDGIRTHAGCFYFFKVDVVS